MRWPNRSVLCRTYQVTPSVHWHFAVYNLTNASCSFNDVSPYNSKNLGASSKLTILVGRPAFNRPYFYIGTSASCYFSSDFVASRYTLSIISMCFIKPWFSSHCQIAAYLNANVAFASPLFLHEILFPPLHPHLGFLQLLFFLFKISICRDLSYPLIESHCVSGVFPQLVPIFPPNADPSNQYFYYTSVENPTLSFSALSLTLADVLGTS